MSKLLFFDIDGTLVDFKANMAPSTIDALRKAQKNGHKIFLCTGRGKCQIYEHLLDFGFDGIVGGTGAYVEYNGEVLYNACLGTELMSRVIECFKDTGASCLFGAADFSVGTTAACDAFTRLYGPMTHIKKIQDNPAFRTLEPDEDFESYADKYPEIAALIYCESPYTIDELKEKLGPSLCVANASFKDPDPYSGEITMGGNDKGTGIQIILNHLGKTKDDVITFGDSENDLGMLDFGGTSVVMGNASDAIKKHADYITGDVDQDGIYQALKHFELI